MASLDERELVDHHSCRLGKWWGAMKNHSSNLSSTFHNLDIPHKLVHDNGKEAARLYKAGDTKGAMDAYFKMDEASGQVVKLLDELIAEAEKS
jgi:methyl-accepting chemotaxis protein